MVTLRFFLNHESDPNLTILLHLIQGLASKCDDFVTRDLYTISAKKGICDMNTNARYASFLLRLRWVQTEDRRTWVASLQSTVTGEDRSFPSVGALLEFLQAEFGGCQPVCPLPTPNLSPKLGRGEQEREYPDSFQFIQKE